MAGKLGAIGQMIGRGITKGAAIGLMIGLAVGAMTVLFASGFAPALAIMGATVLHWGLTGAVLGGLFGAAKGVFNRPVPDAEKIMANAPGCEAPSCASPVIGPAMVPQVAPAMAAAGNPAMDEELRHLMAQMNVQQGTALPPAQPDWQGRVAEPATGSGPVR